MRLSPRTRTCARLPTLFACLVLPVLAFADSVDELRALVNDGKTTAAWDMAQRLEPDNAGDPEFDFWYAMAARAAGQKLQAVMAFERVALSQPENARAKLELADAQYQFGNVAEARRLFEEVLATTPPDPVQQRIRTYLAAMDAAAAKKRTQVSGFVTVSGGHDSNVNNATSVVNHDFGPLTFSLLPGSLESPADFMDVRAGVNVVNAVNQRQLRFIDLQVQSRDNEDVFAGGNYDFLQVSASGGWMLQQGDARWRIPVNVQALRLESDENRYLGTVGVEYSRPWSSTSTWSLFGQAGEMHYPSNRARTALLGLAGGAWVWNAPATPLRATVTGLVGTEPVEDRDFEYNGRDYVSARVALRYGLTRSQVLYGGAGVQHSKYQDEHPVLLYVREDTLVDTSIGWQWQIDRAWSVNIDISRADNASRKNDLYDYKRTQSMLGATWRF